MQTLRGQILTVLYDEMEGMAKKTILVVDDNKNNLDLMLGTLSQSNYRVLAATSGRKAITLCEKLTPDLILMDIMMPGMNGFETTRQIKQKPDLGNIPILFLSALNDLKNVVECFNAGGVDYISKPFRKEELLARVHTHLSIKELQDKISRDRDTLAHLMRQILPENIIETLSHGEQPQPSQIENAVILFTDFSGFTTLSKALGSQKTIEHLTALFSTFDEIMMHFGLERLKIIGDAYMGVGNVNNSISQPYIRGILAGLKIQEFLQYYNEHYSKFEWKARIGVHIGTIMAGIIGTHRIAFDVWGDAVNLASRLETKALTEGVTVTPPPNASVDEVVESYSRGTFNLRNLGETELIQVIDIKGSDSNIIELYKEIDPVELIEKASDRPLLLDTISQMAQK